MPVVTRRDLLAASAGACVGAGLKPLSAFADNNGTSVKVAAVQFSPVLGDVDENLSRCESLTLKAINDGARWIVLPEFFSSGLAMSEKMWDAYRPIDGEPAKLLKQLATRHDVCIGGSFLAQSGSDVFNTFVLATPDESLQTHDKDFPSTIFESSFYAGGEDGEYVKQIGKFTEGYNTGGPIIDARPTNDIDGIFEVGNLKVGAALCWELVRYRTPRRLRNRIDILLGASGWWWGTPEHGWPGRTKAEVAGSRSQQLALIREAPRRLARMIGAPVVHANFIGLNHSFLDHAFANPADRKQAATVTGRYLGQSQIVRSDGRTVKMLEDAAGVLVDTVELGRRAPEEQIPQDEEWMPELKKEQQSSWATSGGKGRDFYLARTRKEIKARFAAP